MRGVPVNESARDGGQVKCVSDVDIARLKLKSSISLLEKRISSLDDQATTHREKAITFKVNHDKPLCMIHFSDPTSIPTLKLLYFAGRVVINIEGPPPYFS